MKQTLSLCLSIMKSISVWKWKRKPPVPEPLRLRKSCCDHRRMCFLKWLISCCDFLISLRKSMNMALLWKERSNAKFSLMQMLLGRGTWPALNDDDIHAAQPLKLSKHFLTCLCLREIFDVSHFSCLTGCSLSFCKWTQVVSMWLNGFHSCSDVKVAFLWMEFELNCQAYDNKTYKLITMSLNNSMVCGLWRNMRASRNYIVTLLLQHGCLETKTIKRILFMRRWPQAHTLTAAGGQRLSSS